MPAGTRSQDAVSNAQLVLGGNGPTPPEYQRPFSQKNSLRFHQEYLEYERKITLSNLGQSVQRQVLKRTQLLPNSVRATLSRIYFRNAHGRELEEDDLLEALTKHAECWAEAQTDPHVAFTEVSRIVTMGKQPTAVDRIDAVYDKLSVYFENPRSKALFCEVNGAFKPGPAQVITKHLVAGLTPPEFRKKVDGILAMRERWKEDPELVFDLIREAATDWRTVEQFERDRGSQRGAAEKAAPSSAARRKQKSTPGPLTCWTCGEAGHRSGDCPKGGASALGADADSRASRSHGSAGSAKGSAGRPRGASQTHRKGTPAARGGSQQRNSASSTSAGASTQNTPVAGRVASTSEGDAKESGDDHGVVPSSPLPEDGEAASPGAAPAATAWRGVSAGGEHRLLQEEFDANAHDRSCQVDLSVPGMSCPDVCPAVGILDSGAGLTAMSASVAQKLQKKCPDVSVVVSTDHPHQVKTVEGRLVTVTEKTCPVRMTIHTQWGPVVLDPRAFAVMPGTDDVVIIGDPTLTKLGIDVYEAMAQHALKERDMEVRGVDTPGFHEARRISVSVEAFTQRAAPDPPDAAVERLVARGPDMVMTPAEEEAGRADALDRAVDSAADAGLSPWGLDRLRQVVDRRFNVFRRGVRGDPPANVPPMTVKLKTGAKPVKARLRTYNPDKTKWLTTCLAALVALGLVYVNLQAIWASAIMLTPKRSGDKVTYRFVGDFRAVNRQIEKSPGPMPDLEADMQRLSRATCYGSLDMLQGYWGMPLAPEAQEIFTMIGPGGLYSPERVPQGVLNATSYYQGTMNSILHDLNCIVWVDDIVYWGETEEDLLNTLDLILARFEHHGLFVAAHKCTFYTTSVKWCGKVYSKGVIEHDRDRLSGLANLRRPETAGELMQFLQAVNWLRTSLPRMSEIVAPLREFLELHMAGNPNRTKRVASNRAIAPDAWTPAMVESWERAQDMVANAVTLYHPVAGKAVLMFPDASDEHWGSFVTQVPQSEVDNNVPVEDMSHEPLGFLSGTFRGSQLRWATVDKEGFAIISTFRRLEYLLWGGVHIHTDHRNLAYIFDPEACISTVPKTTAQRLENWKAVLGQYDYTIQHISGERNCWGDLLSRWVNVPAVSNRSAAVFMPSTPDCNLPSKNAIREVQQTVRASVGDTNACFTDTLGRVAPDDEGLFRVMIDGRKVLWIPDTARDMQLRLMLCAHMKEAGHRGVTATMHRLREYCCWSTMDRDVKEFVQQCLHCMDSKSGEIVPRPFGETVHGKRPGEVLHFDYLHVGKSGPLGADGLDESDGYVYLLVMMDDLSNFAWMEPTGTCTARLTAQHLLNWCKTLGVPEVWVSDTATHFKNSVMDTLEKALGVERRFTVANSPWSNGTCERMMREIVRTMKAVLQERRRNVRDWVDLVPAVQWALNTAYRERYASTPYHVMFGRAPRTSFSTLASSSGEAWNIDTLDATKLKQQVQNVIQTQAVLHKQVQQKVDHNRARQRAAASRGDLPAFTVGDYVMVARVRRSGITPKLSSTWTGPWRVVSAAKKHVYGVQNIVNGQVRDVHVARLRFYADSELNVTSDLKDVFQHSFGQGEHEMESILNIGPAHDGSGYLVRVRWAGFEEDEDTWQPLSDIYQDAPQFLKQELRKMKLSKEVKDNIKKEYGIVF
ncbi:unnamed protein product [Ectocarpus sp. CCAP 1310/34]|nr:unnamed protein product [Ectocarpus sp. CCAP 1310/34]